ncbi:unnamed protein product, partial [Mesorhabditis spiculigera]
MGPPLLKRLKGYLFGFLVFITSLMGSIFILLPFLPVAYLSPIQFRWIADRAVGYWLTFPASLLEFVYGVKFRLVGDVIDRQKPALIIMNHRTRLDWLFLWNALYKMDPWLLTTEKITLKNGLKKIPGAGWAMSCASYIFLERNIEKDRANMHQLLKYYSESGQSYQILLFPEGTDRDTRSIEISDAFAENNRLPKYLYTLHPRTTGFTEILKQMRENQSISCIYDVTIAYPVNIVQSEKQMITEGDFPERVDFCFRKYDIDAVPEEDNQAIEWLNNLWRQKEATLERYYNGERQFKPVVEHNVWPEKTTGIGYTVAFGWWVFITLYWINATWHSFWIKAYVAIGIVFYIWTLRAWNGIEFLLAHWFFAKQVREGKEK